MQKFFDRKSAYQDVKNAVKQIKNKIPTAIWVEGRSGVGKTRFMEYVSAQEQELNIFKFLTDDIFYKCECSSLDSSFEFVTAIIFELQRQNPAFFEKYIQGYFNNVEHITFLDACCLILPQIKGIKFVSDLMEKKYNNITTMQSRISDRLVTYQLIDLFSDLILVFLKEIYYVNQITFCIDDAQWLDHASIRVLENLIKKRRMENKKIVISVFLTIHEKSELSDEEKQNYLSIYRVLSNLYPDLKTIYLENFDLPTTTEVIKDTERYYLIEQIPLLYKVTNGNPLELEQTLRFSDERIRIILQTELNHNSDSYQEDTFTIERVFELYKQEKIYVVILNILSVLQHHISIHLLYCCTEELYRVLFQDVCIFSFFSKALSYLKEKDYIDFTSLNKEIFLKHNSIYRIVVDYLSQNGDYIIYGKAIAKTLLTNGYNNFLKAETHQLLALKLLCEVDPKECIKSFKRIYVQNNGQLEPEFFIVGANAICSDYLCQTKEDIQFTVCKILPQLISSANLTVAQRLCHIIYRDFEICLSTEKQIIFLINYIKAQIDLSVVKIGQESAINLFEKLYKLNFVDNDLKLQAILLGMSTYEHVLAHKKIYELFLEAKSVVDSYKNQISDSTMSVFYRNKGLCFSHSALKYDYFQSLLFADHVTSVTKRHLLFGTSMNNLGLSYFYNGNLGLANKAFSFAKSHLDCVGYNTARISNNIGVCCYMLHDWQNAYHCLSVAASEQTEGNFMRLCIQTNLALILYTIDKCDEAKNILDTLIEEYIQKRPQSEDTLVYCAAMINRGYIAFKENDYFKAADYYQKSLLHTYRYQDQEQLKKRNNMRDICIQYGIDRNSILNTDMDLTDMSQNIYQKPYSLIPFAFYVI